MLLASSSDGASASSQPPHTSDSAWISGLVHSTAGAAGVAAAPPGAQQQQQQQQQNGSIGVRVLCGGPRPLPVDTLRAADTQLHEWLRARSGMDHAAAPLQAELLARHASAVNTRDLVMGWSPLHYAAAMHNAAAVAQLLEAGADPDMPCAFAGVTPLHLAVAPSCGPLQRQAQQEGVQAGWQSLYECGVRGKLGGCGSPAVVQLLLEAGADVCSAAMPDALWDDHQAVAGCCPSNLHMVGTSPLHVAACFGQPEQQGGGSDSNGGSPASRQRGSRSSGGGSHGDGVSSCCRSSSSSRTGAALKPSPQLEAAQRAAAVAVRAAADTAMQERATTAGSCGTGTGAGASSSRSSSSSSSSCSSCCCSLSCPCYSQALIVSMLVVAGADVNVSTAVNGETPLIMAAGANSLAAAAALLEAGADIDGRPRLHAGRPLDLAVATGHAAVALLLLRAGACVLPPTPDAPRGYAQTFVASIAAQPGADSPCPGSTDALHERPCDGGTSGQRPRCRCCGAAGADASHVPHRANTHAYLATTEATLAQQQRLAPAQLLVNALTQAADGVYPELLALVRRLLDGGCPAEPDLASPDAPCTTPLQRAVYCGSAEVVRMLLDGGADVNAGGVTSLHRAGNEVMPPPIIVAAYRGHCHLIRLLAAAGADLTAVDGRPSMGRTQHQNAAQRAACMGHLDAVLLLVGLGCPWHQPRNLPQRDYLPALVARHCIPGVQASAVEYRLRLAEKRGKQQRAGGGSQHSSNGSSTTPAPSGSSTPAAAASTAAAASAAAAPEDLDALATAIDAVGSTAAAARPDQQQLSKKARKQQKQQNQQGSSKPAAPAARDEAEQAAGLAQEQQRSRPSPEAPAAALPGAAAGGAAVPAPQPDALLLQEQQPPAPAHLASSPGAAATLLQHWRGRSLPPHLCDRRAVPPEPAAAAAAPSRMPGPPAAVEQGGSWPAAAAGAQLQEQEQQCDARPTTTREHLAHVEAVAGLLGAAAQALMPPSKRAAARDL